MTGKGEQELAVAANSKKWHGEKSGEDKLQGWLAKDCWSTSPCSSIYFNGVRYYFSIHIRTHICVWVCARVSMCIYIDVCYAKQHQL